MKLTHIFFILGIVVYGEQITIPTEANKYSSQLWIYDSNISNEDTLKNPFSFIEVKNLYLPKSQSIFYNDKHNENINILLFLPSPPSPECLFTFCNNLIAEKKIYHKEFLYLDANQKLSSISSKYMEINKTKIKIFIKENYLRMIEDKNLTKLRGSLPSSPECVFSWTCSERNNNAEL